MELEIAIRVDTNDGDYAETTNIITPEQLEEIKPLIEAIKERSAKYGHAYPTQECASKGEPQSLYPHITEEIFELFEEFCPSTEYGFYSIERIEVYPIPVKERLI